MILGVVVGGIFERYLFISTELYGPGGWLLRPIVVVIVALIVWALYRPFRQIAGNLTHQLRQAGAQGFRFPPAALFSVAVIAVVIAALIVSGDWPAADRLVPRTAAYAALFTAGLNLILELFGADQPVSFQKAKAAGGHDNEGGLTPVIVWRRAATCFLWIGGFIALAALIGFLPAILVFILAYMRFAFGEPWRNAALTAGATTLFCWALFDRALAVPWPPSVLGDLIALATP
jgi:hypothetical protein